MKEIFTARLKSARGSWSQQVAADKLGIKQQAYARYESGSSTPGIELLTQICRHFNVSADWLLGLSDERNPSRGGVSVSASHSSVAINGHANTINNCQNCPVIKAAAEKLKNI
jgi:transcriptional regulator with XRE-family HTH domain